MGNVVNIKEYLKQKLADYQSGLKKDNDQFKGYLDWSRKVASGAEVSPEEEQKAKDYTAESIPAMVGSVSGPVKFSKLSKFFGKPVTDAESKVLTELADQSTSKLAPIRSVQLGNLPSMQAEAEAIKSQLVPGLGKEELLGLSKRAEEISARYPQILGMIQQKLGRLK